MAARRGKGRNQARRNGGGERPVWVWLIAGLAIGGVVFLAAPGLFKRDGDGFVRFGPRADPNASPAPIADGEAIAETPAAALPRPQQTAPQYDFYTVLPGNEVRMSDSELAASARAEQARSEAQRARDALEGRTPAPAAQAALPAPVDTGVASVSTPAAAAVATPATASAAPAPPTQVAAAASSDTRYILQAGAFGASGDAEAAKAKIAMLGLSARVESAQNDGRTVYRVRMGPYGTASELAEAKQKLADGGLQAMAIRAQ